MVESITDEEGRHESGRSLGLANDAITPEVTSVSPASVVERLERTRVGRGLISVLLVLMLLTVLVINMPDSQLKRDLGRVTQLIANATGLDQNWTVFVSPRQSSAYVYARVEYASGSPSDVPIPSGRGLRSYVDYRWQKYEEQLRPDSGRWLWDSYAQYVADHAGDGGRTPVRVSLIRRWADSNPPGPGPDRGPWRQYTFFTMSVRQPA